MYTQLSTWVGIKPNALSVYHSKSIIHIRLNSKTLYPLYNPLGRSPTLFGR